MYQNLALHDILCIYRIPWYFGRCHLITDHDLDLSLRSKWTIRLVGWIMDSRSWRNHVISKSKDRRWTIADQGHIVRNTGCNAHGTCHLVIVGKIVSTSVRSIVMTIAFCDIRVAMLSMLTFPASSLFAVLLCSSSYSCARASSASALLSLTGLSTLDCHHHHDVGRGCSDTLLTGST